MAENTNGPNCLPNVAAAPRVFVFQCSSESYLGCIENGLFGSNAEWPLSVKKGDFCLLHHYDAGTLLGLWRAETDGGRNLVKKAWNGRFPFQVRVVLASPKMSEVPKQLLAAFQVDPAIGKFDSGVEEQLAKSIVESMLGQK
jgi:hypothetical protein